MPRPTNFPPLDSISVPSRGFDFAPTDSTNIIDPNTSEEVLARAVTTRADGNMKVTYYGSATAVIIPMLSGVRRSMLITKIFSTDTDAGITSVIVEL